MTGSTPSLAALIVCCLMFHFFNPTLLLPRFGRKIVLLVSYVFGMLFAIASAFSTTYVMFAVLRFFTGFFINGIVIVTTVLSN